MISTDKTVLVTGASRGIGAAVVRAFLARGAGKIYAAARDPSRLPDFGDPRVVPLRLDVTDGTQVAAAAKAAGDVDIVVNNAGTAAFGSAVTTPPEQFGVDFQTNLYGTLRVLQAFAPILVARGGGVIANVVSVVGLGAIPAGAGYSASKAALHSVTQAARAELAEANVAVLGIYPGPIDTDMARDLPVDKTSPDVAAARIVDGIEAGDAYIFTDPVADHLGQLWRTDPLEVERQLAAF